MYYMVQPVWTAPFFFVLSVFPWLLEFFYMVLGYRDILFRVANLISSFKNDHDAVIDFDKLAVYNYVG